MYSEFSSDPKVQSMSEQMQRRLVMILCLRSSDDLVTLRERDIAFHLRVTEQELAETKAEFIDRGFVDDDWILLNWNKRQFVSDSSTERTRAYRERHRTSQERHCDAPDTDTDTDTEQIQKQPAAKTAALVLDGFSDFWKIYPRKEAKVQAEKVWRKMSAEDRAAAMAGLMVQVVELSSRPASADGRSTVPHPATWLNGKRWNDEAPRLPDAPLFRPAARESVADGLMRRAQERFANGERVF
jgi:hypothetical protein